MPNPIKVALPNRIAIAQDCILSALFVLFIAWVSV
jgi:hypothetical protein